MIAESTLGNLPRVLIIDDEVAIRKFLRTVLSSEEFLLYEAENAHTGLSLTAAVRPDVILLDLGLPDLDGLEVIKRIRDWSQVPIIVLSVREREEDKIAALDAGADDYLTKPFGVGELLARIRAAMRRLQQELPEPVFISDDLEVNLELRRVMVKGKDVQLTPTEYDLLKLLVSQAGKVLTHRHILNKIWGPSHLEQPHVLRVNISNLRRKIEVDPAQPRHITTELGVGYRLV
jgi:two-component system, OmpR family, KDP operon response regulator KdpE